jgi:hypothetical protein
MDASKITELRQRQANRYISRANVVDASTLTWQRQIESSKYIAPQLGTSSLIGGQSGQNAYVSVGTAGVGPGAVLLDNGTYYVPPALLYPNPLRGAKGSAGSYTSCEQIAYQRAGENSCGVAPVSVGPLLITLPTGQFPDSDIFYPGGGNQLYAPPGTDVSGNWLSPYLPLPQPYSALTTPPVVPTSYYRVNLDPSENNYETATYVHNPLPATLQNGQTVYSTIAPNMVFIPTNNGQVDAAGTPVGTLVQDGTTKPRSVDPRSLP